jgi:hypothetical protein
MATRVVLLELANDNVLRSMMGDNSQEIHHLQFLESTETLISKSYSCFNETIIKLYRFKLPFHI